MTCGSPQVVREVWRLRLSLVLPTLLATVTIGLPLAWQVETAKDSELPLVPVLLDIVKDRSFAASVVGFFAGGIASGAVDSSTGGTIFTSNGCASPPFIGS